MCVNVAEEEGRLVALGRGKRTGSFGREQSLPTQNRALSQGEQTAMQSITLELGDDNDQARGSLKIWLLQKAQAWINGLLEAEMEEHLHRKR